jgi:excisionase family DNA binding protein
MLLTATDKPYSDRQTLQRVDEVLAGQWRGRPKHGLDKCMRIEMKRLLTIQEAMKKLGVSRRTLYRLMNKEVINFKISPNGRRMFREEDIDNYYEALFFDICLEAGPEESSDCISNKKHGNIENNISKDLVVRVLGLAGAGVPIGYICRENNISEPLFFRQLEKALRESDCLKA